MALPPIAPRDLAALSTEGWVYHPEPSVSIHYLARHVATLGPAGLRFAVTVKQPFAGEDVDHGCKLVINVYKTWRRLFLEFQAGRLSWAKFGSFEAQLPKTLVPDLDATHRRAFFRSALLFTSNYGLTSAARAEADDLLRKTRSKTVSVRRAASSAESSVRGSAST
jgi:hypothetical protein